MKKHLQKIPAHLLILAGLLPVTPLAFAGGNIEPQIQIAPEIPAPATVAFLGVETAQTDNATQKRLNLENGTGLRVNGIAANSPAAEKLQLGDVLTHLDDQLLVNQDQLRTLVRAKKTGDTARISLFRDGEKIETQVTLGVVKINSQMAPPADLRIVFNGKETSLRDLIRENVGGMREHFSNLDFAPIDPEIFHDISTETREMLRQLQTDIKTRRDRIENRRQLRNDALSNRIEIVEETPENDTDAPPAARYHQSVTSNSKRIVNGVEVSISTRSVHDENGTATLTVNNGKKQARICDLDGKVIFEGAIDTDAQRDAMTPEARARLETLESLCARHLPAGETPDDK